MNGIVGQLVLKDWQIMRKYVIAYWLGGIASILIAIFGGEGLGIAAMILFVTALGAVGIHAIMQTIVVERTEHKLPLIMSLPVTIREYTLSKIIINLSIFTSVWATLSGASLVILFAGEEGMPDGMLPFVCIVLVAMYFAYTIMLVTALVSNGLGATIVATVVGNIGTQMGLWQLVDLTGIQSTIDGPVAAWNSTHAGILLVLIAGILVLLLGSVYLRFQKRDVL